MKKIKWTIMTLAILFSISAAFATRTHHFQNLYYWNGSSYQPAGTMGVTYACVTPSSNVCTYTFSGGVYTPYMTGSNYTPITLTTEPKKDK